MTPADRKSQELAFALAAASPICARWRPPGSSWTRPAPRMSFRLSCRCRSIPDAGKIPRAPTALGARSSRPAASRQSRSSSMRRHRVADADPARCLCEHAARDHGDLLRRPRRRQRDHRAAAYAGARPARSVRAARGAQHAAGAAGRIQPCQSGRSRGRLRRHRDADARTVRGGMGAVPRDRKGRRPVCFSRAEPDPAQGRSDPQGARGQYRKAPRRAHRRQRIPEPARGRNRCAAGKTGRARALWRGEIQVRSRFRRCGSPRPSRRCATSPTPC